MMIQTDSDHILRTRSLIAEILVPIATVMIWTVEIPGRGAI